MIDFEEDLETLASFRGIRNNVFKWFESQGSEQGIRALGFRSRSPNKEADELGLRKDGFSRRGVQPCFRLVDNAKKRGLKALPKRIKRKSIRMPV